MFLKTQMPLKMLRQVSFFFNNYLKSSEKIERPLVLKLVPDLKF